MPSAPTFADLFPASGIFAARRTATGHSNYSDDDEVVSDTRYGERADSASNTGAAGAATSMSTGSKLAAYGEAFPPLPSLRRSICLSRDRAGAGAGAGSPAERAEQQPVAVGVEERGRDREPRRLAAVAEARARPERRHRLRRAPQVAAGAEHSRPLVYWKAPDWILPVFYETASQANGKPSTSIPAEVLHLLVASCFVLEYSRENLTLGICNKEIC